MTTYIGITGTKGVGKSTLAAMLKDELPVSEIIAFADALRSEVNIMLNFMLYGDGRDGRSIRVPRKWLEDRKGTVFGPLLQGYGEFARQWFGPDYWINLLEDAARESDTVIVPDMRHMNEAEWVKAQGGLLVAIVGPSRWEGDQRDANHPSEANVPACQALADVTVRNHRDLEHLQWTASDIAGRVKSRNVETMLVAP